MAATNSTKKRPAPECVEVLSDAGSDIEESIHQPEECDGCDCCLPRPSKRRATDDLFIGWMFKRRAENGGPRGDCPLCDAHLPTLKDVYKHALGHHNITRLELIHQQLLGDMPQVHIFAQLYVLPPISSCCSCNTKLGGFTLAGCLEHWQTCAPSKTLANVFVDLDSSEKWIATYKE